ncbi:uncharacterized protein LOC111256462 [Setaria italica]|nr:uncharacterized protein LOC111256462 [Setaria italica]
MALLATEQGASPAVVDPADPLDPGDTEEIAALACPPDDALVGILSRVPAKSLCRFKCVSKAWCDLIADRLRCRKLPQALEGFFYFGDGDMGSSDGNGDGSNSKNLTHRGHGQFVNLLGMSVPLFDCSFSFLLQHPGVETIRLVRSCNGLFLFGHRRLQSDIYNSMGYIVCNPATEQWVAVPSSGWTPSPPEGGFVPMHRLYTYLIFDPVVSPDFQFVQFWQEYNFWGVAGLHTYSSETGVWRDRASEWKLTEMGGEWGRWGRTGSMDPCPGSAFVNGMVHFAVYNNEKHHEMIVTVDGEGKISRMIRWSEERGSLAFVGGSQGHLHCISDYWNTDRKERSLSIWVLEDYDTEEWVLKHSVNLLQVFGRMMISQISSEIDAFFGRMNRQTSFARGLASIHHDYDVVTIHPDRNLIFFVQHWNQKLVSMT